jgi:hypothetical protein
MVPSLRVLQFVGQHFRVTLLDYDGPLAWGIAPVYMLRSRQLFLAYATVTVPFNLIRRTLIYRDTAHHAERGRASTSE